MHFPVTDVVIDPLALAALGLTVGVLGGFFGVGGGFLAGPMLFWLGVPMNFVVGTDLAHMTGKSIVAVRRHRIFGNVDLKLGLLMIAGTAAGIEGGARLIERWQAAGNIEWIVGSLYVIILVVIGLFTAVESVRALRRLRTRSGGETDVMGFDRPRPASRLWRLPPTVSLPASGIDSISIWIILGIAFATGLLAGTLGVGGGFVRLPLLVYLLGVPTHVAIGTDLFEIVFSAGYGTVTHALKGNVDIMMALVMHTGAALGAHIGATGTQHVTGPRIRLLFAGLPLLGALLVLARLLSGDGHF